MIQDIYPHKLNNQYHPDQKPDADSIILYFTQEGLLHRLLKKEDLEEMGKEDLFSLDEMIYTGDGKKLARPTLLNEEHLFLSFPRLSDFVNDTHVTEETLTYLFSVDDDNYFLLNEAPEEIPEDYEFNTVRELRNLQIGPKYRTFAAITGLHLYNWYRTNRFCGCCGHKTVHSSTERALKCPSCGHLIYPRIVPAVIVGVKNGDKILLTKYRKGFTPFALIAGFTEIGETLEETVAREVMEEAGIRVKNIQYYKSQPWGVVDDLLAGFYCEVDGDTEIHMDASELKLAEWKSRDEIELQPNDFSFPKSVISCSARVKAMSLRGLGCGEELSSLWQAARIQSRLNAAIVFLSISKIVLVLKQLSI